MEFARFFCCPAKIPRVGNCMESALAGPAGRRRWWWTATSTTGKVFTQKIMQMSDKRCHKSTGQALSVRSVIGLDADRRMVVGVVDIVGWWWWWWWCDAGRRMSRLRVNVHPSIRPGVINRECTERMMIHGWVEYRSRGSDLVVSFWIYDRISNTQLLVISYIEHIDSLNFSVF